MELWWLSENLVGVDGTAVSGEDKGYEGAD